MSIINSQRILVLGSSSWLGYLLLEKLKVNKDPLAGTFYQNKIEFGDHVKLFRPNNINDYEALLAKFQPTIIVNFLRGEDQQGLSIHSKIIDYSQNNNSYYLYASSVLALDGYDYKTELRENLTAKASSDYGVFKAICEQKLYDSSINWCILRFASVQGWVPHKLTRNENLLQKIIKGEEITVDRGVIQNRMFADLMVDGIVEIIKKKTSGIIHFGTSDSSEEVEFLKKQVSLFGYSPKLIIEGKPRRVNLIAMPERIYSLLDSKYLCTEEDTLNSLFQTKGLRKYINNKKDHVNPN